MNNSLIYNDANNFTFISYNKKIWNLFIKKCKKNNLSETTIKNYTKCFKLFCSYLSENFIDNPTEETIYEYRDYLISNGKKPTTVKLYLASLKCLFKFTYHQRIYDNVAEDVKSPKLDNLPKKDYFDESQMSYLLEKIKNSDDKRSKRDFAIISLMASCGLRDTEVVNANWGDIDSMGAKWKLHILGKGRVDKGEFVVLPHQMKMILDEYRYSLDFTPNSNDPIFISLDHKAQNKKQRLTVRSVSRIAKNRFIEAGFDSLKLTAHSLRRTTITLALKNGELLEAAQQCARHKNLATTMIYNNALITEENTVTQTVADVIFDY